MKTVEEKKREYLFSEEMQNKYKKLLNDTSYANEQDDDQKNPWFKYKDAISQKMSRINALGLQLYSLLLAGIISDPSHMT